MKMSLLIDAPAFRGALERDIAVARRRVALQTLSFEGDAVGRRLAVALHRCGAMDRRVIVDSFNRVMLSGRCLLAPAAVTDAAVQREAAITHRMLTRLHRRGVPVRMCAPLGRTLRRMPARNHKKSIIVDDVAYLGGFNFTEHNFAWHDMMLRIEDSDVAAFLHADFCATWQHAPCAASGSFPGIDIDVLDGRSNPQAFARLFDLIGAARSEIFVHTPYLMFPFVSRLAHAVRRGVRVTVVTPAHNTVPSLRRYIGHAAARHGFDLRIYPGRMSHLKAMLIDGESLIVGSSNFDYLSYHRHQEIVAYVSDVSLIRAFGERIVAPDLALSVRAPPASRGSLLTEARLRATSLALVALSV